MATRTIPLCSTKGCPTRLKGFKGDVNDWHVPWCGHGLEGHHHHVKKRSQGGTKGYVVFICPRCHDKIDNGPWGNDVLEIPGVGTVYTIWDVHGKVLCERIIEAAPGQASSPQDKDTRTSQEVQDGQGYRHPLRLYEEEQRKRNAELAAWFDERTSVQPKEPVSLESVPDEQLAALFAEADKRQAEGFLLKCRIVHTFRERHVQAWGASWTESAYELFHISRRTLNAYANLHEILDISDRYLIEQIAPLTDSRSLMTYIGRKKVEDGGKALEAAVAYLAKYAEPPTVPALQHQMGEEAKPPKCCPDCGGNEWEQVCKRCGKER